MGSIQGFIYVNNDNAVTVNGLKDLTTDTFINDAVVNATLQDCDGNNIAGGSWPVTLSYIAASDGEYRGVIQDTVNIVADTMYQILITAVGNGFQAEWTTPVKALVRK